MHEEASFPAGRKLPAHTPKKTLSSRASPYLWKGEPLRLSAKKGRKSSIAFTAERRGA